MEDLHIISVDIGTSAARIILFDLDANPVRIVNHPYSLISPKPNWSEQDPDKIVHGVVSGLREIISGVKNKGQKAGNTYC